MPKRKTVKKKEEFRKPVDVISKRSLKDVIAKVKYGQPGTRDMPIKIRDNVDAIMPEYEQAMKDLFNQFSSLKKDLEEFYAPFTTKKRSLELIKSIDEKSYAIAAFLSQMEEEDKEIFLKGYSNTYKDILLLFDRIGIVDNLSKYYTKQKKNSAKLKIEDLLKNANISLLDKKEMMKGKKYSVIDLIVNKYVEALEIEEGIKSKDKINEQIERCEQYYNDVTTSMDNTERRRAIFDLLNGVLALPASDIKAYDSTNVSFAKILDCAYSILTKNEEEIEEQKKKNMLPKQSQANIINCLLLEYAGYHLNDAYQKSVLDLRKEFSPKSKRAQEKMKPAVKAYLDECARKLIEELIQEDIDEAVRPEIEREKKEKTQKRAQEKKKKEKEQTVTQRKLTKEEKESIENFFKYVQNPVKRGRGRPRKEDAEEIAKQEAFLKANEEMLKEARKKEKASRKLEKEAEEKTRKEAAKQEREKAKQEKLKQQAQQDLSDDVYEGLKQRAKKRTKAPSAFISALNAALADVDAIISKNEDANVSLTINYKNGKIKLTNKNISLPDTDVDGDDDASTNKK